VPVFAVFDAFASQDSFTPVSLTLQVYGDWAGSELAAQVANLFSIKKEEKATKLGAWRSFQELLGDQMPVCLIAGAGKE